MPESHFGPCDKEAARKKLKNPAAIKKLEDYIDKKKKEPDQYKTLAGDLFKFSGNSKREKLTAASCLLTAIKGEELFDYSTYKDAFDGGNLGEIWRLYGDIVKISDNHNKEKYPKIRAMKK